MSLESRTLRQPFKRFPWLVPILALIVLVLFPLVVVTIATYGYIKRGDMLELLEDCIYLLTFKWWGVS